ncbi:MAG TPA: NAD-dependent epimerase/dehydratase family protein [Candidatus Thermoplasmatota archaeon]|nr:NAD-dependent epimerase/dehydratase family protein [Candidatus Thermoplasmatota archaeon]
MKHLVTGGAGFIGSHLVDALLAKGHEVVVYDDLSSGKRNFLAQHETNPRHTFVHGDVLDAADLALAMKGASMVWHVAADPDVRTSGYRADQHVRQNVVATLRVLEAMRLSEVKRIAFTSTSTVYGEAKVIPTPEDYAPLQPISLYGASKLGSESLLSAFSHTFDLQGVSFRFANIVGPRSTHGVTYDFYHKLKKDPKRLEILGDGRQLKSYCHVDDTVSAMLHVAEREWPRYDVYNIGSDDAIDVFELARVCMDAWGLKDVELVATGGVEGGRGWKGDVKRMGLATEKIKSTGWRPKHTSAEAIRQTALALVREFGPIRG